MITPRRHHAALALSISAILFGACTAAQSASPGTSTAPTVSISPTGSPESPTASLAATPSATPEPTPLATPSPTPAPPLGPLTVTWHRAPDPATPEAGDWEDLDGSQDLSWTKIGDRFVLPVSTENSGFAPQVWVSTDGLRWSRETLPRDTGETLSVSAVTLGGPGLVALGVNESGDSPTDAMWTSADGLKWSRVQATGLPAGQEWLLRATANHHVSYAAGPVDVTTYHGPANDTRDLHSIVDIAGTLTAFETANDNAHPVGIWSADATGWHRVGDLAKSNGATVLAAVHGAHGWYARGCGPECSNSVAWTSADGIAWGSASVPQLDRFNALVADMSGFVAVGERITGTGCALGSGEIYGETWTSSDGRSWRKMPDQSVFKRASIHGLIVAGRTLYGLGLTWPADGSPRSTAWSATLPADSITDTSPTPTPDPSPAHAGCGD